MYADMLCCPTDGAFVRIVCCVDVQFREKRAVDDGCLGLPANSSLSRARTLMQVLVGSCSRLECSIRISYCQDQTSTLTRAETKIETGWTAHRQHGPFSRILAALIREHARILYGNASLITSPASACGRRCSHPSSVICLFTDTSKGGCPARSCWTQQEARKRQMFARQHLIRPRSQVRRWNASQTRTLKVPYQCRHAAKLPRVPFPDPSTV
ncbi:hypothetical protein QBC32DRAFT_98018 [Pseudoneurospora amorphoporcata]|uniref:Uncharacterized protein n=1 Tax=Pseudoneurospora amorphoporcata TaxID=241081 RepID=A0AAN6SBT0_9PEZI|nr:hypothetical protein QBC32DRAFT_98018 [Pseudoneurospora amorphoporcata]